MNKYVILSTDNNESYYSLLPLVCHSWRKIGYTPIVFFVNINDELLGRLTSHLPGVDVIRKLTAEGTKASTLAQLWRLFAHKYCNDDAVLVTADADMVIARDIFTHDVSQGQIVSYGFDLTGRSEIPICYVKATAAKWRELMGEFTIPDKSYSDKWEDYWSVDQQLLTQRANQYGMNRITFIDRGNQNKHGLPTGRWDRHDWAHIPDSIIDVHMKRGDWNAQIQVFERLWPGEDHSFITKFMEALEGNKAAEEKAKASIRAAAQAELIFIQESDKHKFLVGIDNWSNHRPLLLLALHLAPGDVYEFGCGDGSTPYLRQYCEATGRRFRSFESNEVWALRCGSEFVKNWDDDMLYWPCSVAFVDHAPGEHRHVAIKRLAEFADIICIHDTEEGGAGDYKYDRIWPLFKYRLNYNKTGGGAGATLVSNKIDVNRFRWLSLGQYTFDND